MINEQCSMKDDKDIFESLPLPIGSKVPAGWLEPFLQLMRKNQNLILDYGILEK
jgi:hypothetical protein